MPAAAQNQASENAAAETLSLLDRIIAEGRMAHDDSQQDYARDMLAEFATQVLDEGMAIDKDTVAMINDRISKIDELISAQLNEVLHHPDLQNSKRPGAACTCWCRTSPTAHREAETAKAHRG